MPKQIADISEVGGYERIYISPHIDDVVFSCPASIVSDKKRGGILVVTVFGQYQNKVIQEIRKQEEVMASQTAGYDFILGKFCDASCREPRLRTFRGIFGAMLEHDNVIIDGISMWLHDIIMRARPSIVLAPLGVGRHIDHRLVHASVKNILYAMPQIDVWWYEDRPYAFASAATEFRLRELGYTANVNVGAFLDNSLSAHYLKMINENKIFWVAYCNLHKKIFDGFSASDLHPSYRLKTFENYSELWSLINLYRSQVAANFGKRYMYESLSRKFAKELNVRSIYAERQWKI